MCSGIGFSIVDMSISDMSMMAQGLRSGKVRDGYGCRREATATRAAARSLPGHDLERGRASRRQALAHTIDVWWSDVDPEQHGAVRDLALQRLGTFRREAGGPESRRQAARGMSGCLAKLGRERAGGHDGSDSGHRDGDGGEHEATELAEACCQSGILELDPKRRVHLIGKLPRLDMIVRDDRDVVFTDPEGMKPARRRDGRSDGRKQRERERMRHGLSYDERRGQTGSDRGQTGVRPGSDSGSDLGSDPGQTRVRPGSDRGQTPSRSVAAAAKHSY